MSLVDRVVPARLGRDFRFLLGGFGLSNLADGVLLAAGPLLVTTLTRDPFLVSMAVLVQRLPWLVFGIPAGAIVDRVNRRRLVVIVDLLRAVVVGALAITILTDVVSLPILYAVLFALGTAETFGDNASGTLIAATVPTAQLGLANSRLVGVNITTNQLAGPPLGALLYGVGASLAFGVNVALFGVGAVLVARISTDGRGAARPIERHLRSEVGEGITWLRNNAAVRRLVILILVFNVTFGAAFGILVLYALEILGLSEVGFGLLLTTMAVGGVMGSALFERFERRWSYATMLRAGLLVETFTHLGLALTSSAYIAGAILLVFGVHAATWGSLSSTIRLRAVPEALLGRVTSVYLLGVMGGLAIGTPIGGLLADQFGIESAFWFAFVGAGVTTVWSWRSIDDIGAVADVTPAEREVGDVSRPAEVPPQP